MWYHLGFLKQPTWYISLVWVWIRLHDTIAECNSNTSLITDGEEHPWEKKGRKFYFLKFLSLFNT